MDQLDILYMIIRLLPEDELYMYKQVSRKFYYVCTDFIRKKTRLYLMLSDFKNILYKNLSVLNENNYYVLFNIKEMHHTKNNRQWKILKCELMVKIYIKKLENILLSMNSSASNLNSLMINIAAT